MLKTLSQIIIFLILATKGLAQNSVLGYYENQTGATERMGEIIEVLPNNEFKIYAKRYHETLLKISGNWTVIKDTLFLQSQDTIIELKIENQNRLRTFLADSLKDDFWAGYFDTKCWTKTKGYYNNGQLESVRQWSSISIFPDPLIESGVWIFYHEDHTLKAVGRYKKGYKVGKWLYFDKSGYLIRVK